MPSCRTLNDPLMMRLDPMLEDFYNQQPPEILHHYTDAGGLLGIAKGRQLWATHIRYMNDAREFIHAMDLAGEYVDRLRKGSDSQLLLNLRHAIDSMPGNTFVISFSGEDDLLSQWRGYCPSGGYSLDFHTAKLREFAVQQRFVMVKCTYDRAEQSRLIECLVDTAIKDFADFIPALPFRPDGDENYRAINFAATKFFPRMQKLASAMKDPAFATEKEWRLVGGLFRPLPPIDVRVRGSVLIPYEIFRLHSGDGAPQVFEGVIPRVLVGPNSQQELAQFGAERLNQIGYLSGTMIHASRIPYRNG